MSTRKKSQNQSVSSDERKKKHGSTAPHGVTGRGKTHIGGNSLGSTQGSTSPPATGQRSPGIPQPTHRPPANRPMDKKTHLADQAYLVTGYQACLVTRHQPSGIHRPPGKWARKRLLACQSPGTDHPGTGHWNQIGKIQWRFKNHQAPGMPGHQAAGHGASEYNSKYC